MSKENILHKWLNGNATSEEIKLLKASPEYASYLKIAEASSTLQAPLPNSDANYTIIEKSLKKTGRVQKLNPYSLLIRVAAIAAIILAGYVYFTSLETSVTTEIAEKKTFFLPDASEVVLNSGSTIRYSKKDWNNTRELYLEGEAYFKVKKGKKFAVNTASGTVSVLGTHFNVYDRNDLFSIQCFEGLVGVRFNDTLIKVPAGTGITIENGILIENTNTQTEFPSWTKNESSFKNAKLSTVLKELQRQYSVTLTANLNTADFRYTGSFIHNNLDTALRAICEPLHLTYIIEGESVTLYAKENK